jgi:hypothetical protein
MAFGNRKQFKMMQNIPLTMEGLVALKKEWKKISQRNYMRSCTQQREL